ncbi:MAG: DEAD/DEAH box helicase [Granulosicoccus sp.]
MPFKFNALRPHDIVTVCGKAAAARGQALWRNEAVLALHHRSEYSIVGLVQGSLSAPYEVAVLIDDDDLICDCSCPVSFDCKHVAALLYQQIHLQGETQNAQYPGEHLNGGSKNGRRDQSGEAKTSDAVDDWLEHLFVDHQQVDLSEPEPEPGDQLVLYELDAAENTRSPGPIVKVVQSRLLKRGGLGKEKPYYYEQNYYYPRWVTALDKTIFKIYESRTINDANAWMHAGSSQLELTGSRGYAVLEKLLITQRLYLGSQREQTLTRGEPRSLTVDWQLGDDAQYQLHIALSECENWQLIPTEPPWYLDANRHCIGLLHDALSARLLRSLLSVPPVPKERAQVFSNLIATHLPDLHVPLPVEPDISVVDETPRPMLLLQSRNDSANIASFYASLMMRYGPWALALRGDNAPLMVEAEDEGIGTATIRRKPKLEMQIAGQFMRQFSGMRPALARDPTFFTMADWLPSTGSALGQLQQWQSIIDDIPVLESQGWVVRIIPPFDIQVQQISEVQASIKPAEGGWFDMGLHVVHDGQSFDLVPHIADWLSDGAPDQPLLIQSDSGVFAEVPVTLIQPIADTMLELFDNPSEAQSLRVSPARALTLNALDEQWQMHGISSVWQGGDKLFKLAEKLKTFTGIKHRKLPNTVKATLRPYQLDGVAWLGFLSKYGFNGILADDMGLGKTLQTLAFLEQQRVARKLAGPVLIIAPTSLLSNWAREAARFTPKLTSRIWHGSERKDSPLADEKAKLVITSYALALRDHELLAAIKFSWLVLDEAQAIKNPAAKITQAVKLLPIERRLCLTGTPLENHLHELWSQFDFLMPNLLGSRQHFARYFRTPIENHGNSERQARLNAMIRPFMLRRKKEEVAADLPPKTEIIREVLLEGPQATLYESIRASMEAKVRRVVEQRGLARSHIEMLEALLKLRQTCCHPQLVKLPSARKVTTSAKTELVMSMLTELISEGKKILLFSQFTEMLGLLETELHKAGIDYVKLTGRTRKRDVVIDAFQQGDVPLFLISLKAGGTGLNLTAADTVIHYDPWWNPAVENQASDRAHRIGQNKPVFVYKLITLGTVEEKILLMQEKKQKLADQTLGKGAAEGLSKLKADDILQLFSPAESG